MALRQFVLEGHPLGLHVAAAFCDSPLGCCFVLGLRGDQAACCDSDSVHCPAGLAWGKGIWPALAAELGREFARQQAAKPRKRAIVAGSGTAVKVM